MRNSSFVPQSWGRLRSQGKGTNAARRALTPGREPIIVSIVRVKPEVWKRLGGPASPVIAPGSPGQVGGLVGFVLAGRAP